MNSKADVKNMISPDPKVAINFLVNLMTTVNDNDRQNNFLTIKQKLELFNADHQVGTVSMDDYTTKVSQITANILYLIDSLPDAYFTAVASTKTTTGAADDADYTNKRVAASKLIGQLCDSEIQYALASYDKLNAYADYDIDDLYKSKREALVYQIIWYVESNNLIVSSSEYVVIAKSLVSMYDDLRAEQYYKKAISNVDAFTASGVSKIAAMRSYASFLYLKGRFEDGAKQYDAAILEGEDNATNSLNGFTMQLKSISEGDNQNNTNAETAYNAAMAYYNKITNEHFKQSSIKNLIDSARVDVSNKIVAKKSGTK